MRLFQTAVILVAVAFSASLVKAETVIAARDKAVYGALDDYEGQHSEAVRSVSAPLERSSRTGKGQGGSAVADNVAPPPKTVSFDLGYESYDYEYREENSSGQEIMKTKGTFKGIFASMVYRPLTMDPFWSQFMDHYIVDARMAWANVDYTGGFTSNEGDTVPVAFSGRPDVAAEIRGLFAKDYPVDSFTFTVFTGLGYRYLRDDGSSDQKLVIHNGTLYNVVGYLRQSNYVYLPLGVDIVRKFPGKWTLGLNGEYDMFLWGMQRSGWDTNFIGGGPNNGSVGTNQNGGYGLRGSVKLAKEFPNSSFFVEPYIRYWSIDISDFGPTEYCTEGQPCHGVVEPKNTTREVGAKVGMTF